MNLQLALVSKDDPNSRVSAGWLSSGNPIEWLREVARCQRQDAPVAMYPVAAGNAFPAAVGVMLVPRGKVPDFGNRVTLLKEILPGVHAPKDSFLNAGLLENERRFFFPYELHFFHPSIGVIGFEAKDELIPQRLLLMPSGGDARWNLAIPVRGLPAKFEGISVVEPPAPDAMLESAGKEIGDQSDQPPADQGGVLGKAGMLGKGLAGGVVLGAGWVLGNFSKAMPFQGNPSQAEPSREALKAWAKKNWKLLVDGRNREIDRLMKLMETNPDEGLRYALPLAGIEQSRGMTTPGWQLGARKVSFSHGAGGGASDGWDIGDDARLNLERQYREAAAREFALGRHERAAYIYGNLLGDWARAAKALAEGGRYQDAVSIYLHKLHNRIAAAKCCEEAGLLAQAANLYAEHRQFEKAGDLHAKMGNIERAMELWRAEVEEQPNGFQKARILLEKIRDKDSAMKLLDAGWQSGNQPEASLSMMFSVLREDRAVQEAVVLVIRIFQSDVPSFPLRVKLALAHGQIALWDEEAITLKVEEEAYRRIGEALSKGDGDSRKLLDFLPKLDSTDLLLQRDAKRFSIQKNPPKVPAVGPPQGALRPELVKDISLNGGWHSLSRTEKGVSVAGSYGVVPMHAELIGTEWEISKSRMPDPAGKETLRHLALTSPGGTSRLFHFKSTKRLHHHAVGRSRSLDEHAIDTLGNVLAAGPSGADGDFVILQLTPTHSLSVSIYSEAAIQRTTLPIDLAPPQVADLDWVIAGHGGHLCLAADGFLAWRHPSGQFLTMNLGESPASLRLSPLPSVREAVISLSADVLLVGIPKPGKSLESVNLYTASSAGKFPPVSCYLPDGSVAVAYRGGGMIFSPEDRLNPCATLRIPTETGDPIDISPSGGGGFVVLTSTGRLVVFES